MANPQVEAKLNELSAEIADLNERFKKDLAAPRWPTYVTAAGVAMGLFGLGVAFTAILLSP